MAQSWEAPALGRENLCCGKSWITGSAGTSGTGWHVIAECARSCTWELLTRISAASWELIGWKWQKKRKIWVYLLILRWPRTPNMKQLLMKSMISTEIFPGEEQKVNTVTQSSAATSSGFMQLWSLLIKGHKLQMCLENNYRGILIFFFLCKNLEIIYLAKNVNAEKGYSCSLWNFREYAQK